MHKPYIAQRETFMFNGNCSYALCSSCMSYVHTNTALMFCFVNFDAHYAYLNSTASIAFQLLQKAKVIKVPVSLQKKMEEFIFYSLNVCSYIKLFFNPRWTFSKTSQARETISKRMGISGQQINVVFYIFHSLNSMSFVTSQLAAV